MDRLAKELRIGVAPAGPKSDGEFGDGAEYIGLRSSDWLSEDGGPQALVKGSGRARAKIRRRAEGRGGASVGYGGGRSGRALVGLSVG